MKIRNDFVTNSSSSSFIISKENDINNTEKLFQFLKITYASWINAKEQMLEFCKNHSEFKIETEKTGYTKIRTIYGYKTEEERNKNRELSDMLVEKFGIDYWDSLDCSVDWMSYDTYEDYLAGTKNEKYIDYHKKPFILLDFNNVTENTKEEIIDVIQWYYPCYRYCDEVDCDWCNNNDTDFCKRLKNKENIEMNEFGNLCVFSECGYIPDFVREKLEKICTLHCNHMG